VWVVAGPPGAGKSTVATLLLERLDPVPALLDKDTLYHGFVSAMLAVHGRDPGEREGAWYDEHIKRYEYDGLTATAREVRAAGCPVLLCGPFTGQIHEPGRWPRWVAELGGEPVRLVWVRTDEATVRARLAARGLARDSGKLADFTGFASGVRLGAEPVAPHLTVDNRLGAGTPLAVAVAEVARRGATDRE
jgi:predicted kinase